MSDHEFDWEDEMLRFIGRSEYFEAEKEVRNIAGILSLLLVLGLFNAILSVIYVSELGCTVFFLMTNVGMFVPEGLYLYLARPLVWELEEENEYDPDTLLFMDRKKTKLLVTITLGGASLFSLGAVVFGFISGSNFRTYFALIHFLVTGAALFLTLRRISEEEIFRRVRR